MDEKYVQIALDEILIDAWMLLKEKIGRRSKRVMDEFVIPISLNVVESMVTSVNEASSDEDVTEAMDSLHGFVDHAALAACFDGIVKRRDYDEAVFCVWYVVGRVLEGVMKEANPETLWTTPSLASVIN